MTGRSKNLLRNGAKRICEGEVGLNLRVFFAVLADKLDLIGERGFGFGANVVKDVGVACLWQSRVDRGKDLRSHLADQKLRCSWS